MRARITLALGFCLTLASASTASAAQIPLFGLISGSTGIVVPTQSYKALKFATTIEQEYDFSCGSAALATLLTYSYQHPETEQQVFSDMFKNGDQKLIENSGFSLLDMKNYLTRQGYASAGFRAPLEKLSLVSLPAIVLINESGYNHFVVVRGFRDGEVLLADPAIGMRIISVARFSRQWSGIFFLILNDAGQAQQGVHSETGWKYSPAAPYGLTQYALTLAMLQQVTIRDAQNF
jgi:predicted double-glycine peptidase